MAPRACQWWLGMRVGAQWWQFSAPKSFECRDLSSWFEGLRKSGQAAG
jgi:hypothetical protein